MPDINPALRKLVDNSVPLEHRKKYAVDLIMNEDIGEAVLERMATKALSEEAVEMEQEIRGIVENLQRAPMKPATFVRLSKLEGSTAPLALVAMDNGEMGYMVVHDGTAAENLNTGDRVALDGKAKILIGKALEDVYGHGPEAKFERRIDDEHIEVTTINDGKMVVLTSKKLADKIESKTANPGDSVVLGAGGTIAKNSLPATDTLNYCRFLDRGIVPDVIVDRDIGAPPRVIQQVALHVREEMMRPELRRRFRLRPCITRLLSGVSGSGKTLAVQAIHRLIYEIMSDVTNTSMDKLPHRVFKFKTSQVLSMWLGESDKNAERLFDEVEKLAAQTFTNAKGKEFTLPVMVVMEEAEGMGRTRGSDHDGVYDRILSTLLQRLDPNRAGLGDRLIVFLSTTNEPHLVDPAFLRRIGGQVEHFGRLNQEGFVAVLKKHIEGLPAANGNDKTQKALWKEITREVEAWLYSEREVGIAELRTNSGQMIVHYKDFITGALVDRSVQQAASEAWESSLENPDIGITTWGLTNGITHQVNNVVSQLTTHNITHYLDLPEGTTVSNIKRLVRK